MKEYLKSNNPASADFSVYSPASASDRPLQDPEDHPVSGICLPYRRSRISMDFAAEGLPYPRISGKPVGEPLRTVIVALFSRILRIIMGTGDFRRVQRIARHILRHHSPCRHDHIIADGHAGKDRHIAADPHIIPDDDRLRNARMPPALCRGKGVPPHGYSSHCHSESSAPPRESPLRFRTVPAACRRFFLHPWDPAHSAAYRCPWHLLFWRSFCHNVLSSLPIIFSTISAASFTSAPHLKDWGLAPPSTSRQTTAPYSSLNYSAFSLSLSISYRLLSAVFQSLFMPSHK